eukprot:c8139_g1_i1.p1 GENE.c8139_g1_i1~~c8139_g1_i1.p1  ORF type:complete len:109 (-),score=35.45 c8139_g1_i1:27-353(-)
MDGFLLVFSVEEQTSLEELLILFEAIQRIHQHAYMPIVIAANKCDLTRTINLDFIQRVVQVVNAPLVETSAKTGQGVNQAFLMLTQLVLDKKRKKKRRSSTSDHCSVL